MKNLTLITILFLLVSGDAFAQQEKGIYGTENWLNSWTEFRPGQNDYDEPTQILSGNITENTTLYKKDTYLLLGNVFVTDSTTLIIQPGTVIMGDFKTNGSLTISNGATLIAEGEETDPIIFTSNKSVKKTGDWGGLFILGDAPINKFGNESAIKYGLRPSSYKDITYGGNNVESSSGVLRYIRIEYAGKRTKEYGYFNGLTLAGVGNKTIIENIMVSYCQGNSFNVIGGEVNLDKLVSFRSSSIDYVFNYGTQCVIKNSLAVRSPYVSGANGSRCMYIASSNKNDEVDLTKNQTFVSAQNLTMLNNSNNLESDIQVGLVREALYIDQNASLQMNKTVISGFNQAVILDDKIKVNNENLERIMFSQMYFNNCNGNIFTKHNINNEDLENWYGNQAFFNVYSKGSDLETFIDSKNAKRPDFRLLINKIVASND